MVEGERRCVFLYDSSKCVFWPYHAQVDAYDLAQGASRGLQATAGGVHFLGASSPLTINTLDAPTVRFGQPYPFPTPLTSQPDLTLGASICLLSNAWNTNCTCWQKGRVFFLFFRTNTGYAVRSPSSQQDPYWQPFEGTGIYRDYQWRFQLQL